MKERAEIDSEWRGNGHVSFIVSARQAVVPSSFVVIVASALIAVVSFLSSALAR